MSSQQRRQGKKSLREKRRKLRRVKKNISDLKREVNKEERKLKYLKHHKRCMEISVDLSKYLPGVLPSKFEKEEVQKLVDAFDSVSARFSRRLPQSSWPGIKRFRNELDARHPFLQRLHFYKDYGDFVAANALPLWIGFCTDRAQLEQDPVHYGGHLLWSHDEVLENFGQFTTGYWYLCAWRHQGRVFRVTSLLTNTFSVADIPVSYEFIQPPFMGMLFEMPPKFTVTENGRTVRVSDVLVTLGHHNPKADPGLPMLNIIAGPSAYATPKISYCVVLGRQTTIQKDIQDFVEGRRSLKVAMEKSELYQLINFVCNAILYCTSFPDDVLAHNELKLKKLQERLERQKHTGSGQVKGTNRKLHQARNDAVYIIGKNFKLTDERASKELSYEDGRRLRIRHIVRGHWRNQACGPKHQDRKLTFIQPHWRGHGKEGPAKTYVVK